MSRRGLAVRQRLLLRASAILASGLAFLMVMALEPSTKSAEAPGGPISVGGPDYGIAGVPFTWAAASMPVPYRVDPGPLAVGSSGTVVVSNASALSRIAAAFANWTSVPTAAVSVLYAGPLLSTGAYTGGAVVNGSTDVANFNALVASCEAGTQNPVVFDPGGELAGELGVSDDIIGFDIPCAGNSEGNFQGAMVFLEGEYQNGSYNFSTNEFNQAMTHEFGHFLGLDHSQINVDVLNETPLECNSSEVAGLPVMFPFFRCQDRVTSGLPALSPDDTAWISQLYPVTAVKSGKTVTSSVYGSISGAVFFSDGANQAQGVNVIARSTNNPLSVAFSSTSGYLFAGQIGQSVTCALGGTECITAGAQTGSRNSAVVGTFDIPVTPGTYTVNVEPINAAFAGGSGVGSLRDPPIAMPGTAPAAATVTVVAGGTAVVNVTLVGTPPPFDEFETSSQTADLIIRDLLWLWRRPGEMISEALRP